MTEFNFTDPNLTYSNIPFDQVNYSSAACIVHNIQTTEQTLGRIEFAGYVLVFLIAIDTAVTILDYIRRYRGE